MDNSFYRACDKAYHNFVDGLPQFLQERPMMMAYLLGAGASYGSAWVAQKLAKHILPEKTRRIINASAGIAAALLPIAYAAIAPDSAKSLFEQHPVYSAGLLGLISGVEGAAIQGTFAKENSKLEEMCG